MDLENVSQRIVPFPCNKALEKVQIFVPVVPREPPTSIFFRFWLRNLQSSGCAESQITILSNCPTLEGDYICQHSYDQGNTGIVHIKPKNGLISSNWSKVRWIKFGFTKDWNPVLWLANDSQSERLEERFEKAATSEQSGVQFEEYNEVMREDLLQCYDGVRTSRLRYEWPEGKAVVEINQKTGLREFVIHQLNLQISVQLQPYRSPSMALSENANWRGPPMKPMMVWVVDIAETKGEIADLPPKYSPPEYPPLKDDYESNKFGCICSSLFQVTLCLPCSLLEVLGFVCNSTECYDDGNISEHVLYPCFHEKFAKKKIEKAKRAAEQTAGEEYMFAKSEYEKQKKWFGRGAQYRLPVLS